MSSTASLIFYITTFLFSTFFVYQGNKDRALKMQLVLGSRKMTINPFLIIGAAIPVAVAGFRQDVGTDFANYLVEYNAAIQSSSYLEISFNVISNISNTLFGFPTFMFAAFSALTVIPIMLALNKSSIVRKDYRWLFWLLFLFIIFPQTFNLLRQGVAVAIGFYALITVLERRKILTLPYVISTMLAISFHMTAWVLIPLGFVANYFNNRVQAKLLIFMISAGAMGIVFIAGLPHLLDAIGGYWSAYLDKDTISRSVLPRSVLIVTVVLVSWKYSRVIQVANSYIALVWIGLICTIGGLFVSYFERVGYYVSLLIPILIIVSILQFVSHKQQRLVCSILCVLGLAYFLAVYYLMGSSDVFPYQWSFSG